MKVRYLRCDGTSVWKDVEDWGEEIRLRCLEREITFVTLHGPIQAFGKLAEDLLSIGDGLGPTGFRQTLQRRFAAVEGSNEICGFDRLRSEEHTSELQSLMRTSYAGFCLKKKKRSINE